MKKIICYLLLMLCMVGCSKEPGELTQEMIERDLGKTGISGETTIIERDEEKNKIKLKVDTIDVHAGSEIYSYMTYKVKDGEWVLDKCYVQYHNGDN